MSDTTETTSAATDTSNSLLAGAEPAVQSEPALEANNAPTQEANNAPTQEANNERPEFLKEKYKTVDDQAKAYVELEKKLGSFTGAPETYELPEGFNPDDAVVQKFSELGKKYNINQELFNELTKFNDEVLSVAYEIDKESEMKALGDNASDRINNVAGFLKANLGDRYEDLSEVVSSAKAVELVEALIGATKSSDLPISGSSVAAKPTQEDVDRLMTEKDANGRVIYKISEARQKQVQDTIRRMLGE